MTFQVEKSYNHDPKNAKRKTLIGKLTLSSLASSAPVSVFGLSVVEECSFLVSDTDGQIQAAPSFDRTSVRFVTGINAGTYSIVVKGY